MYEINFGKPEHVHFIGIGGISMSGLAEVLLDAGFRVSGSDNKESELTKRLSEKGADITIGQKAENIRLPLDCIVYTAAIHPDNPEFVAAVESKVPMLTRAQLLGQIMRNYQTPIAVAGTHGKTTTTSMLAQVFLSAGLDPTVSVGGILPAIGGNIRVGSSGTFVTEACEYTNSFLSFFPKIALILNVEEDHMDFFKDLDDIANSFNRFARLVPEDGTVIICKENSCFDKVTDGVKGALVTYSLTSDADYTASDISFDEYGCGSFTCLERGTSLGSFALKVPGMHNISNALAVIACSRTLGLEPDVIRQGFDAFTGAERRFEYKGTYNEAVIIDDYAHHPSEIRATLNAAANYPHKKLIVAFQPHTYTRTKAFLDDFAKALSVADQVLLADIYAAREQNTIGISSKDLMDKINALGGNAEYLDSFEKISSHLRDSLKEGDLLITMGAGNINEVGEDLL